VKENPPEAIGIPASVGELPGPALHGQPEPEFADCAVAGVEYARAFRTSPFPTRWIERSLPPADPFSVERRDWIAEQIRCDNGEARWRLRASTALRIIELLARRDCP
jgi:hypothetical protein